MSIDAPNCRHTTSFENASTGASHRGATCYARRRRPRRPRVTQPVLRSPALVETEDDMRARPTSHRLPRGARSAVLVTIAAAIAAGALGAAATDRASAAPAAPSPLARDEEFVVRFSGRAP